MTDKRNKTQQLLNSRDYSLRLHAVIPGGAHTYSRGDDQFPANAPKILDRGHGTTVWTPDGQEFLDYGMGLRSVSIGYSEPKINEAAIAGLMAGNSLTRASTIELRAAELLVDLIDSVDMVKFTKNGSTATSAAVKLARAYTGRKMVARCAQHPFFSFDDWFIGSTPITKGIPESTISLTKTFNFNDINSLESLVGEHPNEIACVILEPAAAACPATTSKDIECCGAAVCTRYPNMAKNYLQRVEEVCRKNGIIFILDETITGFRWHLKGAQHIYGVTPDLTTFGKAMANGFSVAAVAGRKELMKLGSINEPGNERMFFLSTTHGAEMSGLAAFIATMEFMQDEPVVKHLWEYGHKLKTTFNEISKSKKIEKYIYASGPSVSPFYSTVNNDGTAWYELRTLFAQEMINQGVLMPWLSICYRHNDETLKKTKKALEAALEICKQAMDDGLEKYLVGETIKPVFRRFN